jgi:hypothetical protein
MSNERDEEEEEEEEREHERTLSIRSNANVDYLRRNIKKLTKLSFNVIDDTCETTEIKAEYLRRFSFIIDAMLVDNL